jgi:tetratricopeptide (TPR) repeat protein
MGRFDDAIIEVGHALECDRHSPIINAALGTVLYFSQRYDEAVKQYQRTIKKTPSFVRAHFRLARALVQTGRFTEAIAECKKGLRLSQIKTREIAQLGQVYAMADKFDLALKVLKQLEELSKEYYVSEYNTALIYVAMGADEQAFQWLDRACFSRDPWLEHLNVDPRLAALRTDSRFQVLLKRVYLIR